VSAPDRAAWLAAIREALGIAEAHPGIPLPEINTSAYSPGNVTWWLRGDDAARDMATLEAALASSGCVLAASTRQLNGTDRYELRGTLRGLTVAVSAPAVLVAEQKVTGTRTENVVEWVRRTGGPENGENA
jgi:hypothetical protein